METVRLILEHSEIEYTRVNGMDLKEFVYRLLESSFIKINERNSGLYLEFQYENTYPLVLYKIFKTKYINLDEMINDLKSTKRIKLDNIYLIIV